MEGGNGPCVAVEFDLPDGVWPPTGWYADWVSGLDLFDVDRADCPIELRWLV